jgi:Fe-S cluster assembly protein SufB
MSNTTELAEITDREYEYGFVTDIEAETIPKGLNEEVVRIISAKKEEPQWLLQWRLKAYHRFAKMLEEGHEPTWAMVTYPTIDYQDMYYYSAPKKKEQLEGLDQVDPELLRTYEKLGIPLEEQKRLAGVAVDAVFDSVSVATTYKEELEKQGIIFCPFSEAVRRWTTSSRLSTPRSSVTAPSRTSQRVCAAPWSSRPTSASTPRRPGSSSAL